MDDPVIPWTTQIATLAGLLGGTIALLRLKEQVTEDEIEAVFGIIQSLVSREMDPPTVARIISTVRTSMDGFIRGATPAE